MESMRFFPPAFSFCQNCMNRDLSECTQYTRKEVTFCQLSKIKFFHKMMEPLKQFFGVFLLADDRAGFREMGCTTVHCTAE